MSNIQAADVVQKIALRSHLGNLLRGTSGLQKKSELGNIQVALRILCQLHPELQEEKQIFHPIATIIALLTIPQRVPTASH